MDTTNHPWKRDLGRRGRFCAQLSQQEKLKPFYSRTGRRGHSPEGDWLSPVYRSGMGVRLSGGNGE